jgi:hypothetical protein
MRCLLPFVLLLTASAPARAGLYYSGETYNDLPSQWRGFLLDQRVLRQAAVKPTKDQPAGVLRIRYEKEAAQLAKKTKLDADEAADLGALYVRLGEAGKAVQVLRAAQRDNPVHFRIASNLGTAWHASGDLAQAAAALEQAVKLAPGKHLKAEQLHLRLVRLRAHEKANVQSLDDLFGVRYLGPSGRYEAGKLSAERRKELPTAAVALTQQLALWLPGDARLLWQLAELANAHGDVATAAAIMDGCVTEFGLRDAELLAHRKIVRAAASERKEEDAKKAHEAHALLFKPRSSRPLASKTTLADLPPIDSKKTNVLGWEVIGQTTIDRRARPTFPKYLKELDGLKVELRGYLQPLSDESGLGAFLLIENPVGCWYCEMPDLAFMVLVEMPEGKSAKYTRDRLKVTGRLKLNSTDPEKFLYLVQDATVSAD